VTDAEIVIAIRSDGSGARVVKRDLDNIADSGDKASGAAARLEKQMRSTSRAADALSKVLGAVAGYMGIRQLAQYADVWSDINSRVRIASGGMEQGSEVMRRLSEMARRTYSSLEQTAETYLLNATAMRELGYTTQETLDWVESINNALVVSGAKGERAASVMNALSKAMALGKLSGENLNTVISTGGRVAEALAQTLGVTTNQLRQLGADGKITTEAIVGITSQLEKLREEADSMPATISDAFVLLRNSLLQAIGVFDQANQVSETLAKNIILIADNIGHVINGAVMLAGAALPAIIASIATSIKGLTVVMLANPLFLGLTAASAIITGVVLFRDEITKLIDPMWKFGDVADAVIDRVNQKFAALGYAIRAIGAGLSIFNPANDSPLGSAQEMRYYAGESNRIFAEVNTTSLSDEIGNRAAGRTSTAARNAWEASQTNAKRSVAEAEQAAFMAANARASAAASEASKKATEDHKKLTEAIKSSRTEEERLLDEIKEMEGLRGFANSGTEAKELEKAIARANEELNDLRIKAERNGPVAKAFESLTNEIDDGFREAFRTAFSETDGGWKRLLEGWKATFKTFLADLAYTALARPIVLQIAGVVGGSMGLSSGASAQILGEIGGSGGFSIGNIGSLLSNGWSALSGGLNTPIFSAGSMIGQGINSVGAALGLTNANFIGPMLPGTSSLASAFTPMAGIAGFGGNMLANLLFGGDRGIGSTIGGVLGGVGGTAVGASLGTILGMAGGPVGALIGSFAGNALGGLFGGKSTPSGHVSTNIDFQNGKFLTKIGSDEATSESVNAFQTMMDTSVSMLQQIASTLGVTLEDVPFYRFQTSAKRDGGKIRVGVEGVHPSLGYGIESLRTQTPFTDPEEAVQYAVMQVFQRSDFSGISEELEGYIRKAFAINDTVEAAITDVNLVKQVLGYQESMSPGEMIAKSIEAINEQFDVMREHALKLGLPLDALNEALEQQKEAAIGLVKAAQAGYSSMQDLTSAFDTFFNNQALGANSSLSPMDKLALAQGNFGDLLSKAQGGDFSVTRDLISAATQLLDVGRSIYASSTSFSALEGFVRSSMSQIAKELDIPGYALGTTSARAGLAWVGEEGPELVKFRGGERVYPARQSASMNDARFAEMSGEIAAMRKDMQDMTRQIGRFASQMIVARA
jgi:tape measure domain-containing protein